MDNINEIKIFVSHKYAVSVGSKLWQQTDIKHTFHNRMYKNTMISLSRMAVRY